MPDAISDSGDVSSANLSSTGGTVLTGYASTFSDGVSDSGLSSGVLDSSGWAGSPLFQTGVDTTTLTGGIDATDFLPSNSPLQGQVSSGGLSGGVAASPAPAPVITTQIVKADIRNTVVQPIEPCRSIPYLKLVFLPVDTDVRFRRDLRREVSIPVPQPQAMTLAAFIAQFDGHVHIKDTKYLLRWKQILPVIIQPQDTGSVDYQSVDVYDLRTSILLDDDSLISALDFSQLPLTQVTQATDVIGGVLDPDLTDYELYLDNVVFADVDQSTGRLIAKDPVEAGLFTG